MSYIYNYHFIVTIGYTYCRDVKDKNYEIKAKTDRGAWIIVLANSQNDLNRSEYIKKVELIEVE